MTLSLITHLVQSYGYYAVFTLIALESMGIPLPGETALITAALYAGTTHHLNVVALAAVATFAAFFAGVGKMHWRRFVAANAAGGLLWASFYTLGAYALGNAASSVGSTILIVGYAVASVLTVTSIIVVRRSMRRLEQRAEEAFPDNGAASPAAPAEACEPV